MADTLRLAQKLDLAYLTPRPELTSSRYCLANPGKEYIIYLPEGGSATLNLCGHAANYDLEWFFPNLGRAWHARPVPGGDYTVLAAPYTGDAIAILKALE
jgi:hypothetical protein